MAEAFYVSIAPHNPFSPLSTTVCLHLDTVVPNFLIQEIPWSPDRADLLMVDVEQVQDGYLTVPAGPGWGVDLNLDFVRAHPADLEKGSRAFSMQFAEDGAILDL